MWRLITCVVLAAGCASSGEYVAGPPTTVREPTFDAQFKPPSRDVRSQPSHSAPVVRQASAPEPQAPPASSFTEWFKSGRGWTWGAASRGPVRDVALDRLMADTLTGSEPSYSREPTATTAPVSNESWIYPSAGATTGRPGSYQPGATTGSDQRPSRIGDQAEAFSRRRAVQSPDSTNLPTGSVCPIDGRARSGGDWQPASL